MLPLKLSEVQSQWVKVKLLFIHLTLIQTVVTISTTYGASVVMSGLDIILLHLNFHNISSVELPWFCQWSKSNSWRLICPIFYDLEEEELEYEQVFTNFKAHGLPFMPCFKPIAEPTHRCLSRVQCSESSERWIGSVPGPWGKAGQGTAKWAQEFLERLLREKVGGLWRKMRKKFFLKQNLFSEKADRIEAWALEPNISGFKSQLCHIQVCQVL